MSELFQQCETEFNKIADQIDRVITNFPTLQGDKKAKALIDIQFELNEADQQIKQMEIEISSEPLNLKQKLQQNIKKRRNEWDSLRKRHIQVEEAYQEVKNRENLMDQKIELSTNDDRNGKEKFLKNGAMLSDGTQKLRGALREMYQVEQTSNEATANVHAQNQQLNKMIQDNTEIYGGLAEGNRIVDRIKKNIVKHKIILCGVTSCLVLALIIILWVKL